MPRYEDLQIVRVNQKTAVGMIKRELNEKLQEQCFNEAGICKKIMPGIKITTSNITYYENRFF